MKIIKVENIKTSLVRYFDLDDIKQSDDYAEFVSEYPNECYIINDADEQLRIRYFCVYNGGEYCDSLSGYCIVWARNCDDASKAAEKALSLPNGYWKFIETYEFDEMKEVKVEYSK